jgi:hypothetical protein
MVITMHRYYFLFLMWLIKTEARPAFVILQAYNCLKKEGGENGALPTI